MKHSVSYLSVGLVAAILSVPCCGWATDLYSAEYVALTTMSREVDNTDEQAIRGLIEQYRLGYQQADPQILTDVFTDFTPALQAALFKYREIAQDLTVQIDGIRVLHIDQQEATATFTRRDRFIDVQTGRSRQLQVELTKKFVQHNGGWRMLAATDAH